MSKNNNSKKPANRGLGRGFDSLIPSQLIEEEFDPTLKKDNQGKVIKHHEVAEVDPGRIEPNPHQPRVQFEEEALAQLAASIKEHGILQPLVVTAKGDKYELIAGERRLRAAKKIGLKTVPVIVRSFDEQQKLELALIENIQREDLNPVETATAYKKLMDEFNMSYEDIAARVGFNRTTVVNAVRLLGLPKAAKQALAAGKINEGHARAILAVKEPKTQAKLLELIVKNGWTVQKAETFARSAKQGEGTQTAAARTQTSNPLTESLAKFLNTNVTLQPRAKGGRLVVEYKDEEDLKRITKQLGA